MCSVYNSQPRFIHSGCSQMSISRVIWQACISCKQAEKVPDSGLYAGDFAPSSANRESMLMAEAGRACQPQQGALQTDLRAHEIFHSLHGRFGVSLPACEWKSYKRGGRARYSSFPFPTLEHGSRQKSWKSLWQQTFPVCRHARSLGILYEL
jgi:hypothetical protein